MARLSAENYVNSSPATSSEFRKPSRFKDLFRGSNSRTTPSTGSNTTETTETFPLGAEIAKPGFHKVGLLPSERTEKVKKWKKSKNGENPKESLEKQDTELKDVDVLHALNTGLDSGGRMLTEDANVQEKRETARHKPETQEIRKSSTQDLISLLKEDHMQWMSGKNNARAGAKADSEYDKIETSADTKIDPAKDETAFPTVKATSLETHNLAPVAVKKGKYMHWVRLPSV
jgi:hypothetical protein